MKTDRTKGTIIYVFLFMIVGVTLCGMLWSPIPYVDRYVTQDDVMFCYDQDNIDYVYDCTITKQGNVTVEGIDPQIVFENSKINAGSMKLNIEFIDEASTVLIYYDIGEGFAESYKIEVFQNEEGEYVADLPQEQICKLRLDINTDYKFSGIEFHEKKAKQNNALRSKWYLVLANIIAIIITLIFVYFDNKYNISNKILKSIYSKKKSILKIAIILIISCIIGVAVKTFAGGAFSSLYGFFLVTAIVFNFLLIVIFSKTFIEKPEFLTACTIFLLGVAMVFTKPFSHVSWDTDSHYKMALASSTIGKTDVTNADLMIFYNDAFFHAENVDSIQKDYKVKQIFNEANKEYITATDIDSTIAHLPAGIMIAILRLFGVKFSWIFILGRLPNIFIYAICCYFGMKRLHSGKMIYASVAFIPTLLFVSSDYSYDYWVLAFSMLGMAYFVGMCQEKGQELNLKDAVIMCAAFTLSCIPKQIYFLIGIIPFLMPKNKIKDKKKYYTVCLTTFLVLILVFCYRSFFETTGAGDMRGGNVDPMAQILYVFSNPLRYAKILLGLLRYYFAFSNINGFANYAYLGLLKYAMPIKWIIVLALIFDKEKCYDCAYPVVSRFFVVFYLLIEVVLSASAMYVLFTPYMADWISGCQERYILPMIYPFAAIIAGKGISILPEVKWYKSLKYVIFGLIFIVYAANIYYGIFKMIMLKA